MSWYYGGFKPYVSVAARRAQAAREAAKRVQKGQTVTPVTIDGRTIASSFWGRAWCENLEGYSDFSNRLPRGRSYVRNGSVVHLELVKGRIKALVSGSELYEIKIDIAPLSPDKWEALKKQCSGKIGTLVELLRGKLSNAVMEVVTNRQAGLFPKPSEISMRCSCPDYAGMCKHLAAVMYGVGNRLDKSPELLFDLRAVDHMELIEEAIPNKPTVATTAPTVAAEDLAAVFGIEIESAPTRKPTSGKANTEAKTDTVTTKKHTPEKSEPKKPHIARAATAKKSVKKQPHLAQAVAAKNVAAKIGAAKKKKTPKNTTRRSPK
jgi:uncharacterized Zn finger protein